MIIRTAIIIAAFVLDCILGDPQNPVHPIRIIGRCISLGVTVYKKAKVKSPLAQLAMGAVLTLLIAGLSYAAAALIIWGFYQLNYWLGIIAEVIICYFLIAAKALKDESMKVYRAIEAGDIEGAKKNLSRIVGRDTHNMNITAIVKATVETIAENLSDGIVAPLIYVFIGGVPLGMAYKAVNTLDSMIGYRNDEFEYFGKFAARLDDAVNIVPSRVSALLMIIASIFTGKDVKRTLHIYIRDRHNHKSPNSAQTESVCAGALGLCLGGDSYYQGVIVRKQTIGDEIHVPAPKHIIAANRLMYAAAVSAAALFALISVLFAISRGLGNV